MVVAISQRLGRNNGEKGQVHLSANTAVPRCRRGWTGVKNEIRGQVHFSAYADLRPTAVTPLACGSRLGSTKGVRFIYLIP